MKRFSLLTAMLLCVFLYAPLPEAKADKKEAEKKSQIKIANGKIALAASGQWVRKAPRVKIIDHEFSIPPVNGDKLAGRLTIMGAGGSIEANIARWMGQFSQDDGKTTKDRTVVKKTKIAGQEVHLVDITGNFKERRGPFAPATLRNNYRMLAAIIVTDKLGQYFIKLYGPSKTIAANEKKFHELVNSLKLN